MQPSSTSAEKHNTGYNGAVTAHGEEMERHVVKLVSSYWPRKLKSTVDATAKRIGLSLSKCCYVDFGS